MADDRDPTDAFLHIGAELEIAEQLAMAEGILMARHGVTLERSRGLLQHAANDERVDMLVIARRVIGQIDDDARPDPGQDTGS